QDPNAAELYAWAPQLVARLRRLPQLRDVSSDQADAGLQSSVVIDRTTASRLGVTSQLLDDTLYDAFGQRQISTIFGQSNQYRVVLGVDEPFARDPAALRWLHVGSQSGTQVRIDALTSVSAARGALAIHRLGQFPAVTLSFNL